MADETTEAFQNTLNPSTGKGKCSKKKSHVP